MAKIQVIYKGYTISVTSWENDADNYRTKSITVDTMKEVKNIDKICRELFISCNNGNGGIGNTNEGEDDEAEETINEYIANNPEMRLTVDYIDNLAFRLMGGSEYYLYRVFDRLSITYSSEDIYLEEIKLK